MQETWRTSREEKGVSGREARKEKPSGGGGLPAEFPGAGGKVGEASLAGIGKGLVPASSAVM